MASGLRGLEAGHAWRPLARRALRLGVGVIYSDNVSDMATEVWIFLVGVLADVYFGSI